MSDLNDNNNEFSYTTKIWINVSILALTVVVLLILKATFSVFLLIFAGILIAVFFRGLSGLLHRKTKWNEKVCFSLAILITLALTAGFFWLVGAKIQMQVAELSDTLPKTIENARAQLAKTPIGKKYLKE